jgi:hypothetical protein
LLNRAARFFPILRQLSLPLLRGSRMLEVGSGSLGLGEFWSGPFVGCDVTFPSRPVANMKAVRCSGHQLPFRDNSFDAVVVSDVMEHVSPAMRKQVVAEVLRVTRRIAVFGYPCGRDAFELDKKLYRDYQARKQSLPVWLEEHMVHPFPDENLFEALPVGWKKRVIPNESLRFHYWMMRAEMSRVKNFILRATLKLAPRLVEISLQHADGEPAYRKIFVLTRMPESAHV